VTTLEFEHGSSTTVLESEQAVRTAAAHYKCGSYADEDAYRYFQYLPEQGSPLPTDDDDLRDRAESAVWIRCGLTAELLGFIDQALAAPGTEYRQNSGDWLTAGGSPAQLPAGYFVPTFQLLFVLTVALTER